MEEEEIAKLLKGREEGRREQGMKEGRVGGKERGKRMLKLGKKSWVYCIFFHST